MSERSLRNIFIFGTIFFFAIFIGMTVNSLSQVTSTRTAELTDQVVAGKKAWQRNNCNDCHTILGIGGYFAPELTKVADRLDSEYLYRFIKNPSGAKPGTSMPAQKVTDQDARDLVAFFEWVGKIDTNDWPPAPMAAGGGSAGALVYQQKCASCHQVNGSGGTAGPDLSSFSASYAARDGAAVREFLERWLENPQAVRPAATMPRVPLSDSEREQVIEYVLSLR